MVELLIDIEDYKEQISENFITISKQICQEALNIKGLNHNCEISLTLVSNEEIKKLNRKYKNKNTHTDVLSFPQNTKQEIEKLTKDNTPKYLMLGDIIISMEQAKTQANQYNHSLERELLYLVCHSIWHLLGYDHLEKEDKKLMRQKEEQVLKKLKITRKYKEETMENSEETIKNNEETIQNKELILKAKEAMKNAYTPYSNFQVGAAILAQDGKIYTGCNIENASFGATICGERVALVKAISAGNTKFSKLALITSSQKIQYPCGICRQMLSEFQDNSKIIVSSQDMSEIKEYDFKEILPYSFDLWEAKND